MKLDDVVAALLNRHVQISVRDGDLCLRAPDGAITLELREALRSVKPEVMAWLGEGRTIALPSFTQQRLWFLHQLDPDQSAYHIYHALRIHGRPDVALLQRALNEIVARHESLRTRFLTVAGQPVQVVEPSLHVVVEEGRVEGGAGDADDVEAMLVREASVPFSLEQLPLIRATLYADGATSILLLVIHHAVFDGWSSQILLRELGVFYAALRDGHSPALPPLAMQFMDHALRQRIHVEHDGRASLDFWRSHLAPPLPVLQLPADYARPSVYSHTGGRVTQRLEGPLVRRVQETARREGVTLFAFLLAVYEVLLYRYTGARDIVVGSPVAGREEAGVEALMGFFANTVVMRIQVEPEEPFAVLLARVRSAALDAQRHQDVPFEKIVEMVQPARSRSHAPVFQAVFALQNIPREHLGLSGIAVERVRLDLRRARFDLSLTVTQSNDDLMCHFEYSADILQRPTVEFMLRHYIALLEGFASDPHAAAGDVAMAGAEDREVLRRLRETSAPLPDASSALELLRAWTCATDGLAVDGPAGAVDYATLWRHAAAVACHIRALGCPERGVVAVCMEHGPLLVASLLGVWHAGCTYLPLDPTLPIDRMTFMLQDAGARLVLTEQAIVPRFADSGVPVVAMDGLAFDVPPGEPVALAADDIAYVIYTSGSTGTPKGVLIEHRGVCNLMCALRSEFGARREDRVLFFASIGFDASLFEILLALSAGATVVTAPRQVLIDPEALSRFVERERISMAALPPAMLALMPPVAPPLLRILMSGGDVLLQSVVERWARGRAFFNVYGPTEVSVWSTVCRCEAGAQFDPPIGRPISNIRAYVVDDAGRLLPVGVPGELVLAGAGVGRGYLHRPEESQRAFVYMPWLDETEPVYRTGDMVRVRHDGLLQSMGRRDGQVKLRGYRVEVGEIESALETHVSVRQAVVILHGGGEVDAHLAAYLVPAPGERPEPQALRAHLAARLPSYMAPSRFYWIDAMPVSASGKIDRIAVAALPAEDVPEYTEAAGPRDAIEVRLCNIVQGVFPHAEVGVHDDFFALGGHSLLAVRLMAEVEREFGCKIPLAALFEAPTVEGLARVLRHGGPRGAVRCLVPLRQRGSRPPFFCVHPAPGTVFCYLPLALRLGDDQPFYGIQAQSAEGAAPALNDITAMASLYLDEVRRVQPEGPYYLGGHSAGAVVAFEMARQLRQAGETVALLALMDALAAPAHPLAAPFLGAVMDATDDALWLGGFNALISQFFDREVGVSYKDMAALPADRQLDDVLRKLHESQFLPPDTGQEYVRALVSTTRASYRACWTYLGGAYDGPIAVFRRTEPFRIIPAGGKPSILKAIVRVHARHPLISMQGGIPSLLGLIRMRAARRTPDAGWQAVTRLPVRSTRVDGNHISMLREPHVASLANGLRAAIDAAMADVARVNNRPG